MKERFEKLKALVLNKKAAIIAAAIALNITIVHILRLKFMRTK